MTDRRRFSPPSLRTAWRVAVLLVLAVLLVEAGSYALYVVMMGRRFSLQEAQEALRISAQEESSQEASETVESFYTRFVMHPYLGYIFDPAHAHWNVNPLGFGGATPSAEDDAVVVVITGGSVAWNLFSQSQETLERHLREVPSFAERPIRFVSLATVGFKQPQQLFSLLYYLLLTEHRPDVVINLDGFNEVTHFPLGKDAPIYPAYWRQLAADVRSPVTSDSLLTLMLARRVRREVASWFRYVENSIAAMAAWQGIDALIGSRINSALAQLQKDQSLEKSSYLRGGPKFEGSDVERWEALGDHWRDSSLLMNDLARTLGFHYLHVLQPNQHLDGTKPLTEEERSLMSRPPGWGPSVRKGYPFLFERAEALTEKGVHFLDATRIYEHTSEPVYIDECCHVNELGNRILADNIGRELRQQLAPAVKPGAAPAPPPPPPSQ